MTLTIMSLFVTLSIAVLNYKVSLRFYCYAERHYAECRYAECRCAEFRGAPEPN